MRRSCPQWFQDRLTQVGGRNRHGEPIFKLVWAESETMRVGGYFVRDGFQGYRDVPAIGSEKCWALMMWEPPEKHETPYRWYHDHTDEASGLCTVGEYPYKGRYRLIRKLIHREKIGSDWHTWRMEPTHFICELMVPLLIGWTRLSYAEKLAHTQAEMEAQEKEMDRVMADSLHDKKVRRDSDVVRKRQEIMERTMTQAMAIAARSQLGLKQIGA